jgi:flagellar basal body-associated protein FliL
MAKAPAKAPAKAQVRSRDNFVAYIAAAVVVCLAAIFLFTWNQVRASHDITKPHVAFTKFGPYQIESQAFAMRVSLVVQTSLDDSSWPEKNRKDLDVVFKRALADADPKIVRSPNNLTTLQDVIVKACNSTFNNHVVQAVMFTDFTYQARDEEG